MFIVLQEPGDTMVLDTVRGHRATLEKLLGFLASPQASIELEAAQRCPAYPEQKTLRALRMLKAGGLILTEHLPDGVLQVSGRPHLLARYVEKFRFEPSDDGEHRHPEQAFTGELERGSDMIIIEAEDALDDADAWSSAGEL
jgi:hypothetical protein